MVNGIASSKIGFATDVRVLATALRDLSVCTDLFDQNSSARNRARLIHVSEYVERVLDEFCATEGDIVPQYLEYAIPFYQLKAE